MINKFQQGGKQDAIMQFVQGLAQTLQADPNQIIQIAQQNPNALKSAVQTYQQTKDMNKAAQAFQSALQQQVQAAKHGAKLSYLKSLKHQCAEDEELVYYKKGGSVDCGCVKKEQKGGKTTKVNNSVEAFKKARGKANEADTVHVAGKILLLIQMVVQLTRDSQLIVERLNRKTDKLQRLEIRMQRKDNSNRI